MFHVSTLLPYNKNDSQQLERKRHIGNDIVAVVFQDENTPFAPDMIASNFLHAFIVVQKFVDHSAPEGRQNKYRVCVTARKDVPNFGPPIGNDCIYENDEHFKEWLLNKLINAEYACYKADKFKRLKERTRASLLDTLYMDLYQQNQKVFNLMFPNLLLSPQSSSSSSPFIGNTQPNTPATPGSGSPGYMMPPNDSTSFNSNSYYVNGPRADGQSYTPLIGGGGGGSNGTSSAHNLNSSTSFKFNILNTVRKAFKKEQKDGNKHDLHGSQTNLNKMNNGSVRNLNTNNTQTLNYTSNNTESITVNHPAALKSGRLRSSTFDSGSSSVTNSSMMFKQQLKQQHQQHLLNEQHMLANSKSSSSSRKTSKSEKVILFI